MTLQASSGLVLCPCCEKMRWPRTVPITEPEAMESMIRMFRRGWTIQRLLTEKADDLDYIAPGLTDYLRKLETRLGSQFCETLAGEFRKTVTVPRGSLPEAPDHSPG